MGGQKKRLIAITGIVVLVMAILIVVMASCSSRGNNKKESRGTFTEIESNTGSVIESETVVTTESATEKETQSETQLASDSEVNEPNSEPAPVPTPAPTPNPKPTPELTQPTVANGGAKLQVIGTKLCDASGNPIQLRGISTHGLSWFPQYVNANLFREFHENWNINVVRLAMYTAEYNGYCTGGNQTELKNLVKNGVNYATENQMYVIVDWHVLNDDGNGMHANPNIYKSQAKDFFAEMSSLYKDNPYVIYEICNEPNGSTTWSDIKAYANEVIPVIKANNPDAVIIVGTPCWSQEVDKAAADPITGYSNIMYALHFYAATHTQWLRDRMAGALNAGLPIFVSEYGICDASGNGGINYGEANNWVKTMNDYQMSYVMWNLSNKAETSSVIRSDVSKTYGFSEGDLSEAGKWLYGILK